MGIVGNDTEPGVGGIFLHDAAQRHLCSRGHGVGFVEHDELERCNGRVIAGFWYSGEDLLRACNHGLSLGRSQGVLRGEY